MIIQKNNLYICNVQLKVCTDIVLDSHIITTVVTTSNKNYGAAPYGRRLSVYSCGLW